MDSKNRKNSRISALAYKFYVLRGQKPGNNLEDWFNAEKIINGGLLGELKTWFIVNAESIKSVISFITIAGLIRSLIMAKTDLALTHNAVLFVENIQVNKEDSKMYLLIKNSGNTKAENVRIGCWLLYNKNGNPIPEEKDYVINPGKLIFYPKQSYALPLSKIHSFNEPGFFFLTIYISYNTVTRSKEYYEGIFQYENGGWLEVGLDQESIEKYKDKIMDYLRVLKERLKGAKT